MLGTGDVWEVGCSGCGMLGMWDVGDVGCWGCGMFGMWDVGDVGCWGCGMLKKWDVRDVGFSGFGMFGMWDVWNVGCSGCEMWDLGCLPGCGMLIYKMPRNINLNILGNHIVRKIRLNMVAMAIARSHTFSLESHNC